MPKHSIKTHARKNWVMPTIAGGLVAASAIGVIVVLATQPNDNKTINPFKSSFESTDKSALIDSVYAAPTNLTAVTTSTSTGPIDGYNILTTDTIPKTGYGFTGLHSFKYSATTIEANAPTTFANYIYNDLDIVVGADAEFSYKIFPSFGPDSNPDLLYPSSYASIDLLYSDDSSNNNLKSLIKTGGVIDQYGYSLDPKSQGESKVLFSNQWNSKVISLNSIVGKHVHAMVITYHFNNPTANESILGYIDDVQIKDQQKINNSALTNYVDTRRGTDASADFSRGNNIPATAVPNGFNFYVPMTRANSGDWLYKYKQNNNTDNLPTLNGFGISHEPSPWMGDYQQFNMMPQLANDLNYSANCDVNTRGIPFSHDNEIARPDYYSVSMDNNIRVSITPSSHSAIYQFNFPQTSEFGSLIFDSRNGSDNNSDQFEFGAGGVRENAAAFSGFVDNKGGLSNGSTRMFIYGEFSSSDYNVVNSTPTSSNPRKNINFKLDESKTVTVKIATSYIGTEQAKRNLHQEILDDNLNFNSLHKQATAKWQNRLGAINLHGSNATDTQKVTMYSNLYRLNLYPNAYFENTGTTQIPNYKHASPVLPTIGEITPDNTNAQICPGKMYVNNGFWDTYHTVWPAYQLLYPNFVHELIDGFLLQYEEGGWVARWSSPGYNNLMTGTSSNAAFSDAYTSGVVTDINTALNIFNAGVKDAMVYSTDPATGRNGIEQSLYYGYTPSDINGTSFSESVSWTLEGYINDYALGQMAIKLSNDVNLNDATAVSKTGYTKAEIGDIGVYLSKRSENFGLIFDPVTKFFRAKDTNGNFVNQGLEDFDPKHWGYEFTETDGWNYAFTVPFDVPGLMHLYGGQDELLAKLDLFFNTPETASYSDKGSYWTVIHEMKEARDVRMGQLGMSNQPSHHIPYMYAAAGRPGRTQEITREILQRLYVGSDIGQGYLGDEDNGEMSGWGILSSLGLYDLSPGSGKYIITSPLFSKVTIQRDNGNYIAINAHNNNFQNKYIQSMQIDGVSNNDVNVDQNILLNGNHTISYTMSDHDTGWAQKDITPVAPNDLIDVAHTGTLAADDATNVGDLIDNSTMTSQTINSEVALLWQAPQGIIISNIGITAYNAIQKFSNITVYASTNEVDWTQLKSISTIELKPYEMQQFNLTNSDSFTYYKIIITAQAPATTITISEIQMLLG